MKKNKQKLLNLTTMALFTALIVVMSLTPIGYLKIGIIEISFIMIPVAVGGMLLDPWYGAALGGIFGITSFIQCFGTSAFGTMLMGINPVYTAILCIVPRILAGFLPALFFKLMYRKGKKSNIFSFAVSSVSAALLNTVLFIGTLILLFWNTPEIAALANDLGATNIFAFAAGFAGVNALIEAAVCLIVGTAVGKALVTVKEKME